MPLGSNLLTQQVQTNPQPPHSAPSPDDLDFNYGSMPYTMASYQYHSTAPVSAALVTEGSSGASWTSPLNSIAPNNTIISGPIEGLVGWIGYGFAPQRQIIEARSPGNDGNQLLSMPTRENTWDEAQHYNNYFPLATPPCSGAATPSNTSTDAGYFSSAPMPDSSHQRPPGFHQPTASTRSPPQTVDVLPHSGSKKRKTLAATPKKIPKLRPSKSKPDTAAAAKGAASASEKPAEDRIGSKMLQSCQAQMDDITLSRLKMLGNERYTREVEMSRLADEVEALREAAARNERLFMEALEMAKRRGRGPDE